MGDLKDLIELNNLKRKENNSLICKNCNTNMVGIRRQKGITWCCHTCTNNFFEEIRKPD